MLCYQRVNSPTCFVVFYGVTVTHISTVLMNTIKNSHSLRLSNFNKTCMYVPYHNKLWKKLIVLWLSVTRVTLTDFHCSCVFIEESTIGLYTKTGNWKQGIALTGRSRTVPQCSVGGPPAGSVPTRPAAGRLARRQRCRRRQTTDAREQNNTGPLGGPVIKKWESDYCEKWRNGDEWTCDIFTQTT